MLCIQFTDIHIGREGEMPRDVDVRANLHKVLAAIQKESPDQVVLTGDLSFMEGDRDIYRWIRDRLEEYGVEPWIISGNHDSPPLLADVFDLPLRGQEIYYTLEWEGTPVLFLDTTPGTMTETQYNWLEEQCRQAQKDVIIFMHHPPFYCGVPHMDDNYAFEQATRFKEVVGALPGSAEIFCGHYHVERTVKANNMHVHITPSCFFQIRWDMEEFGVDHYRPAYRRIHVENGQLRHEVVYVE